jgi:hypothetical protein
MLWAKFAPSCFVGAEVARGNQFMKAPNIAKYTDRKHYPNFKVCALLGRAAAAKRGAHIFHRAALMVSTGRSLRTTRAEELERERRRTLLQTFRVCPTQTLGEGCWLGERKHTRRLNYD